MFSAALDVVPSQEICLCKQFFAFSSLLEIWSMPLSATDSGSLSCLILLSWYPCPSSTMMRAFLRLIQFLASLRDLLVAIASSFPWNLFVCWPISALKLDPVEPVAVRLLFSFRLEQSSWEIVGSDETHIRNWLSILVLTLQLSITPCWRWFC
jgi:hypothetical protein